MNDGALGFERLSSILILFILLFSNVVIVGANQINNPANQRSEENIVTPVDNLNICLKSKVFDPLNVDVELLSEDDISSGVQTTKDDYYLIQFNGPIERGWEDKLEKLGVELYEYIPEYTYLVGMSQSEKESIHKTELPIRWMGQYNPELKIHRKLSKQDSTIKKDDGEKMVDVSILVIDDKGSSKTIESIQRMSDKVYDIWDFNFYRGIKGKFDASKIDDISSFENVYWIEPYTPPRLMDEVASEIVGGNWTEGEPWGGDGSFVNHLGYDGTDVTISVADTGIHTGDVTDMHEDLNGRVEAIIDYTKDDGEEGYGEDVHGHGTHCAGIIAGDGGIGTTDDNGYLYGMGIAPGSSIVSQRVFDENTNSNMPKFSELLEDAYKKGAYISSNSWGGGGNGEYTVDSSEFDSLVRDISRKEGDKPMVVIFSAGNSGPEEKTIAAPGTGKNVIAVGSSENYRPKQGSSADNIEEVPSYSSRGPTEDQRIKPDIVAPGTWISSTLSGSAKGVNPLWGKIDDDYVWSGGTSMSTPIVSGSAALFTQYYTEEFGTRPSPAMVKNALISGAVDMDDKYGTDATPNNDEGWGRLDLKNILYSDNDVVYRDQGQRLTTGEEYIENFTVGSKDEPLKIVVTWTDAAGSPTADRALVNDLDLEVKSPDGTVYRGNQFNGGWSEPYPEERDYLNNVEAVYINGSDLKYGEYSVSIKGFNIPKDGVPVTDEKDQDFALSISYKKPTSEGKVEFDKRLYTSGGRPTITVSDKDLNSDPNKIESATVYLTGHPTDDYEELKLKEIQNDSGVFKGSIDLYKKINTTKNNGVFEIGETGMINATYWDSDNGTGESVLLQDTSYIDSKPPDITDLKKEHLPHAQMKISWFTDEKSDTRLYYGTNRSCKKEIYRPHLVQNHEVTLKGLEQNTTHFFYVESTDLAGNTKRDDNYSDLYQFYITQLPDVLLVDDDNSLNNGGPYSEMSVEEPSVKTHYSDALESVGQRFNKYVVPTGKDGPTVDVMSAYDIVLWVTGYVGTDSKNEKTLTTTDKMMIKDYMDSGGRVWLIGSSILKNLYGEDLTDLSEQTLFRSYFHVSSIDSSIQKTPLHIKGSYGSMFEGFSTSTRTHWNDPINKEHSAEMLPDEKGIGILEGDGNSYPYNTVAFRNKKYGCVYSGWEMSFASSDDLEEITERVIGWLNPHDHDLHVGKNHQTSYGSPGENVRYELSIMNNGRHVDRYVMSGIETDNGWDYELFSSDGEKLEDTDGDGVIDTGNVSSDGSCKIYLEVSIPQNASPFDSCQHELEFTSTKDNEKTDSATVNTTVPLTTPYSTDFEIDGDHWDIFTQTGGTVWEYGEPTVGPSEAHSPTKCWGTNINSKYTQYSDTEVISPPVHLDDEGTAFLSFYNWYSTTKYHDGGFVEISVDGSEYSWTRIEPVSGYPYNEGYFRSHGGNAYSGSSTTWTKEYFDISEYIGKTIRVRWRFATTEENTKAGWYIDDVDFFSSKAGLDLEADTLGGFDEKGSYHHYLVDIKNTGGAEDTYNIDFETDLGWVTSLHHINGEELTDTNSDGIVDTGMIEPDGSKTLIVNVSIPTLYSPTDRGAKTEIEFISTADEKINEKASLYTYVEGDILLVDDDDGLNTEDMYTEAVNSTRYDYNLWDIDKQGTPDVNSLASHDAVIWFTGNDKGYVSHKGKVYNDHIPLIKEERDVITEYLDQGGNLYLSSPGAGYSAKENDFEGFIESYFGFRFRDWFSLPWNVYGVDDNLIGDYIDLSLGDGDANSNIDPVSGDGWNVEGGESIFVKDNGRTAGTCVEKEFNTVYTPFDFSSIGGIEKRSRVIERILTWLYPREYGVSTYPDQEKKGVVNDTLDYEIKLINRGRKKDTFKFNTTSTEGWYVDVYVGDPEYSSPVSEIEDTEPKEVVKLTVRVHIPYSASTGDIDTSTIEFESASDTSISDSVCLTTTVPKQKIRFESDEPFTRVEQGDNATIDFSITNRGGMDDTIKLYHTSSKVWEQSLLDSEGNLLEDTDGDGKIDTGVIPGLSTRNFSVNLNVPDNLTEGAAYFGELTGISTVDLTASDDFNIRAYTTIKPDHTEDFADPVDGWRVVDNGQGTRWELGDVTEYEFGPETSDLSSRGWGTNLYSNYTKNADTVLESPLYDLRGAVKANFSFYHWYSIYGKNPGNSNGDGGYLEVSTDLGKSWDYVIPEEGYNETLHTGSPISYAGCYGQKSNGWLKGEVDLTNFLDRDFIQFRFHLWAEPWSDKWSGWYIDNVTVDTEFSKYNFSINTDPEESYSFAGENTTYVISLTNFGGKNDTFDINYTSKKGWNYELLDNQGEPLKDTNNDSSNFPDTGNISKQEKKDIRLKVDVPSDSEPGGMEVSTLYFISSDKQDTIYELNVTTIVPYETPHLDGFEEEENHKWRHELIDGVKNHDRWTVTEKRSHSGEKCWWSGREYHDTIHAGQSALISPYFNISDSKEDTFLSFSHLYSFQGESTFNMDGGLVEIWDDQSDSWTPIYPEEGYDGKISSERYNSRNYNPLRGRNAYTYTGDYPMWDSEIFNISRYQGKTVRLRFHVGWDKSYYDVYREGWYIDDFYIGPSKPNIELDKNDISSHLYPDRTSSFEVNVTNGGTEEDTFDVEVRSEEGIEIDLKFHDGKELIDTDEDGLPDTGSILANETKKIIIEAKITSEIQSGERVMTEVDFISSRDSDINSELKINITNPYPINQIFDFEEEEKDWTHERLSGAMTHDKWERTTRTSKSGNTSWWSGGESAVKYDGGDTVLVSPYIDLNGSSEEVYLSFWHSYQFSQSEQGGMDGGIIEIWDDVSNSWSKLHPEGGYPDTISRRAGNPLEGESAYASYSNGWEHAKFDLSGYEDEVIKIRFHIGWDYEPAGSNGWFIDDVSIGKIGRLNILHQSNSLEEGVYQGQKNVLVEQINISTSDRPLLLQSMRVDIYGTCADSDIDNILIYLDEDEDGAFDPDEDRLLSSDEVFKKSTYLEDIDHRVSPSRPDKLFLAMNVSYFANPGVKLGLVIPEKDYIEVSKPDTVCDFKRIMSYKTRVEADLSPPQVIMVDPEDGEANVGLYHEVNITFDKTMNSSVKPLINHTGEGKPTYKFLGWKSKYINNDTARYMHYRWADYSEIELSVSDYEDVLGNRGVEYNWSFRTIDTTAPIILDNSLDTATTGDIYTVNLTVIDASSVDNVSIAYWFDEDKDENITNITFNEEVENINESDYRYGVYIPHDVDRLYYQVKAVDVYNNTRYTDIENSTVLDDDPPEIYDLSPDTGTTNGSFSVSADIYDNRGVDQAFVYYGTDVCYFRKTMMYNQTDTHFNVTIHIPHNASVFSYQIMANDETLNKNYTAMRNITVLDICPPESEVNHSPRYIKKDEPFEVQYTAADNRNLSLISLYYRIDEGGWERWDSKFINGTIVNGSFFFEASKPGRYDFCTLALDDSGNEENKTLRSEHSSTADFDPPISLTTYGHKSKIITNRSSINLEFPLKYEQIVSSCQLYHSLENGSHVQIKNKTVDDDMSSVFFNVNLSQDGTHYFTCAAVDPAGNVEPEGNRSMVTVILDREKPKAEFTEFDEKKGTIYIYISEPIDEGSLDITLKNLNTSEKIPIDYELSKEGDVITIRFYDGMNQEVPYILTTSFSDLAGNRNENELIMFGEDGEIIDTSDKFTDEKLYLYSVYLISVILIIIILSVYMSGNKRGTSEKKVDPLKGYQNEFYRR